ncbi:MAG: hypothetical protein JW863_04745 [Chitinispirillaceae bacterium]|nr:hypothetical protein [Chitinispirillaceae bacterium]
MKNRMFRIMVILFLLTSGCLHAETLLIPFRDSLGIYEKKCRCDRNPTIQPVAVIRASDTLVMVENESLYFKVKTPDGVTGWIFKRFAAEKESFRDYLKDKYLMALLDTVGIYRNILPDDREQPIRKAFGRYDSLKVLQSVRSFYKVRTTDGVVGWVRQAGGKRLNLFDINDFYTIMENPPSVYIIDVNDPDAPPIGLNRSYKDALRQDSEPDTIKRNNRNK